MLLAIDLTPQLFIDTVHVFPHLNHRGLFVIAFLERNCAAKAQGPEPIVITGCLALVITVIYAHNNTHVIKNTLEAPQYEQQENRPCGVDKSEHMFTKWQPIKSDVCTRTFQLLSYLTNFLSVILPVCLTFLKQISYLYYSSCKN